jgi:hypothetical protein
MPADPHIISRNLTRIAVFLRRLEIVARERGALAEPTGRGDG